MIARYNPDESIVAMAFFSLSFLCALLLFVTTMVGNNAPYFDLLLEYKSGNWFSLYTLIEITSLLGIFHYRYELGKILFNTFSLILNTIIFVPLMCIKLTFYSIQSIMAVLLTIIVNSCGFEAEFSEFWPDWKNITENFILTFKQFNGIREAIE